MKRTQLLILLLIGLHASGYSQLTAYDAGLRSISTKMWAQAGEQLAISGVISNRGTEVLKSVAVSWSANGGETHRWVMENLNISKSRDTAFIHPDLLRIEGTDDIELKVWLDSPNGQTDEQSRNDTLTKTIQVITDFPERHILLEEFTGAWCGWCPRGPITYRDQILPAYPNVILAALHNGDDMAINDGNNVVSTYASGFPSGAIDRKPIGNYPIALSTNEWKPALNQMDREFTPAAIHVYNYYWTDTYEWKIEVVVDFIMDFSGDLRLNCFILEDSVSGSGSGYNQSNYYNTLTDYPELEGAGNPIVGYKHNHVVRDMLAGSWGAAGIIPHNAKRGERYILSRTIKPQQGWNLKNIRLVGVLQMYNSNNTQRPILNASETEFSLATGNSLKDLEAHLSVYPNPVNDFTIVEISSSVSDWAKIDVIDMTGRILSSQDQQLQAGNNLIRLDASQWKSGLYFLQIRNRDGQKQIKLIKN